MARDTDNSNLRTGVSSTELVSVIVPARNAETTLPDCLLALRAQSYPQDNYEIIVVDDGSTDGTVDVALRHDARVVKVSHSGPGAARNRGVEEALGSILLFTDADCVPGPGWIKTLVGALEDPQVVGAKGVYRTEQRSWTARFVQAEYESRYRLMAGKEAIDFIDTYSAAYRRKDFERVGGFDESFPIGEDQELSFRLQRAGARLVFRPTAVVAHRHADSPLSYFRKKVKIGYWKMRVLAHHPGKAIRDTHTPLALKAEIALVGATIAAVPFWPVAGMWWLPTSFLVGFFAVGAPFCNQLLKKDARLASRAPFFLFLRAVALGTGMVLGSLELLVGLRRRKHSAGERQSQDRVKSQA